MRKIIHVDCDCFYASVEIRDDPSLRELPIAIGGESDRRGVIATCNYPAREYGVRSAMASAHARRLCPSLILIPPRMDKYREAAEKIRKIFFTYTELVEPLSLDEAFLDVSDCQQCRGSATLIAKEIRQRIADEVGVTASAGVAPNKFLAKVASDWHKPNGQKVITPECVTEFVQQLPVNKIFGVGKVTAAKLERMGIVTCADLQKHPLTELVERFGIFGQRLHQLSHGEDSRPVKPHRRRKSLSVEHTYGRDLPNMDSCLARLPELLMELRGRLRRVDNSYLITKQFVKIKFCDFTTTTLERSSDKTLSLESYQGLLQEAFPRGNRPVRLLGLGVRFVDLKSDQNFVQLELFNRLV
ncbi:MAG: DNA polymerase IV [Porticoccaceae bacterium]|nr:DNA polymerase IV [Porticoccaceae bacterium]